MVPVVATGPGGASEVVDDGKTGLIVPPNDANALYRALAALADDPECRARMGRAGRLRAESKFSSAAFAHGVADEIRSLVSASSSVVAS